MAQSPSPTTSRIPWPAVRLGAGALILAMLVARVGTGPFLDGLRLTTPATLLTATAVTVVTTVCSAWRWRLVAEGLEVRVGPAAAVAAVYRSQFLNATLPGGVAGDLHRAVSHGRDAGALGRGVRSVMWERAFGQVVQVAATVAVVLVLPSPLRGLGITAAALVAVALAVLFLATPLLEQHPDAPPARAFRAVGADLRRILRARRYVGIVLASAATTAGHTLVFLVAARAAGSTAAATELLPLVAVVLLASAVPLNVAGWGPREGVAAWAFGATGLGVTAGVTTAVVYGVMALVATLPGAVVLLAGRRWSRPPVPAPRPELQEVVCG